MQDIVTPDVDTPNEDDVDLHAVADGSADGSVDGIAVAALIATLRLGASETPGSGAMIVRWCDDGEEIEVQIEPLPLDAAGAVPAFVVPLLQPLDTTRDVAPTDAASTIDSPSPAECPPRRDCSARTIPGSRPARRGRRSVSRSR